MVEFCSIEFRQCCDWVEFCFLGESWLDSGLLLVLVCVGMSGFLKVVYDGDLGFLNGGCRRRFGVSKR